MVKHRQAWRQWSGPVFQGLFPPQHSTINHTYKRSRQHFLENIWNWERDVSEHSDDYCEQFCCFLLFHVPTDRMILATTLIATSAVLLSLYQSPDFSFHGSETWVKPDSYTTDCPCTQIIWRGLKTFPLFNYFVLFHTKKMKWPNNCLVWFYFCKCYNWTWRTNQWHLWLKFISEEYPKGVISEE